MRSSSASLIGLLLVALSPAVADAQPASPPPTWPGHVDGGAVQVDALDVDADVLRAALVPAGAAYVTAPSGKTVTGRVRVAKRAHALAALIAHEPTRPSRRGRSAAAVRASTSSSPPRRPPISTGCWTTSCAPTSWCSPRRRT